MHACPPQSQAQGEDVVEEGRRVGLGWERRHSRSRLLGVLLDEDPEDVARGAGPQRLACRRARAEAPREAAQGRDADVERDAVRVVPEERDQLGRARLGARKERAAEHAEHGRRRAVRGPLRFLQHARAERAQPRTDGGRLGGCERVGGREERGQRRVREGARSGAVRVVDAEHGGLERAHDERDAAPPREHVRGGDGRGAAQQRAADRAVPPSPRCGASVQHEPHGVLHRPALARALQPQQLMLFLLIVPCCIEHSGTQEERADKRREPVADAAGGEGDRVRCAVGEEGAESGLGEAAGRGRALRERGEEVGVLRVRRGSR